MTKFGRILISFSMMSLLVASVSFAGGGTTGTEGDPDIPQGTQPARIGQLVVTDSAGVDLQGASSVTEARTEPVVGDWMVALKIYLKLLRIFVL